MSPMPKITTLNSDRLSCFRTAHAFQHYAEFTSVDEFLSLRRWANDQRIPFLILGGGSNILFKRQRVRSLILKNKLPKNLTELDPCTIEASSTTMVASILSWCHERQLDSFYYLASVPATVGGAIAMNAGRGRKHQQTIYDFVQSVTVLRGDCIQVLARDQIPLDYRKTPFTGIKNDLILSATFRFQAAEITGNPRQERVQWSKENQDYSAPNCGSVFKDYAPHILAAMRGKRFLDASYSTKTINWLLNSGSRSWPLVVLIRITQLLHRLSGRRALLELIEVE
jgi:UDP-N-acetylmuramate dehydrogenase